MGCELAVASLRGSFLTEMQRRGGAHLCARVRASSRYPSFRRARSLHVSALYVLDGGAFVSDLVGAPEFVNRPFHEQFPHGLPPLTPLIAASDGP